MAALINIRRDVQDPFYRYKMPRIQSKIEGKGNGIKTVVPNMSDIAKALSRPPMFVTKYFGFELGAQTSINDSTDRYIVNGAHDALKLQESLDGFIKNFVLCGECKNPETDIVILKDGHVYRNCKACGKQTEINPRHKLTSVILKNPPDGAGNGHAAGGKKSKHKKNARGSARDEASSETNGKTNDDDEYIEGMAGGSDDELTRRINAEAADLPTADQLKSTDDDWAVDTSADAVKARMKEVENGMKNSLILSANDDDDEDADAATDVNSPKNQLTAFLKENRKEVSNADIIEKIDTLGLLGKSSVISIVVRNIFSQSITKEIPHRLPLLKDILAALDNPEKAQKTLLRSIEQFIGLDEQDLIPQVPKILMALYQDDLVDEDACQRWYSKSTSKKYLDKDTSKRVKKAAEPFISWLNEAEEESD